MHSLIRIGRPFRSFGFLAHRAFSSSIRSHPSLTLLAPRLQGYVPSRTKIWKSPLGGIEPVNTTIDAYVAKLLEKNIKTVANQTGFIDVSNPKNSITYTEMKKAIQSIEMFLHKQGFKKGEVATAVLPNCVEFPSILTAVTGRGGIFSALPPTATEYELKMMLKVSESKVIITADVLLGTVMEAVAKTKTAKTIIAIRFSEKPLPSGVYDYKDVISTEGEAPVVKKSPDDVALLPFSSGTTGIPKGVMLTHANFISSLEGMAKHHRKATMPTVFPELTEEQHQEKNLVPHVQYLPFYHIYGMSTLFLCLAYGTQLASMAKFDPVQYLGALQKLKSWFIYLVPPTASLLALHPATQKFDLSNIRYALNGAASLPSELGQALTAKFPGIHVVQAYGLTETAVSGLVPHAKRKNCYVNLGCPVPGLELKIASLEDGRELDANHTGEICLKGPQVMKGYLKNTEDTSKTIDEEGWLHTGDMGFVNDKDEVFLQERIKELIKVKGLQVAPTELEQVIRSSKKVVDVAVVGVPHQENGEAPRAYVVRRDKSLTEKEVCKIVEEHLSEHKKLTGGVVFVSEIPKSPAGKIIRRQLTK